MKAKTLFVWLAFLPLIISSCSPAAVPTPTVLPTGTSSLTTTASASPTLTQTPTQTPTPEPAWYQPLDPALGMLKYHYAQVNNPKARVYETLYDAIKKTGNFGSLPNYPAYVAYTTVEIRAEGTFYYDPVFFRWLDGADLQVLSPTVFTGIQITREVNFRFGWVLDETQSTNSAGETIQDYARYQVIHEVATVTQNPGHVAVGADEWLPEDKVALADPQVPKDAGSKICRFIHVDLAEQVMRVYDNCTLVFATLVSSGANSWTFEGSFNILNKVPYSSIVPPPTSTSDYYFEAVPYFMSYAGNFGFHGAYWHDNFGTAASHGCINLSPTDANWLYTWARDGDRVIISAGK